MAAGTAAGGAGEGTAAGAETEGAGRDGASALGEAQGWAAGERLRHGGHTHRRVAVGRREGQGKWGKGL